jgi:hypothetical protein
MLAPSERGPTTPAPLRRTFLGAVVVIGAAALGVVILWGPQVDYGWS